MVSWNVTSYWWLWNASSWTTLAAWGANAALQSLPIMAFHISKRASKNQLGYLPFVLYWIAFEYVHLHWDLSWPWLNLGNAFGFTPSWIQWYEYTGAFGGTLWILIVNILVFYLIKGRKYWVATGSTLFIPLLVSLLLWNTYEEKGETIEVLAVQPNVDCYTEKFQYNARTGGRNQATHIPYQQQVKTLIELSKEHMTDSTRFVFWPETALHNNIFEHKPLKDWAVQEAIAFNKEYPNSVLVSGVDTYRLYGQEEATETARFRKSVGYYDVFNAAMFLGEDNQPTFYHKSQLVIGVETLPWPEVFKPLMLNMGGAFGGLGRQQERVAFKNQEGIGVAPIICYESVYGEYVTDYVQKGANFLSIITNDGWWNNTPGHRQHLAFASLRAIETRRSIARSANTGISCMINQKGEIITPLAYGLQGAVKGNVSLNKELTAYVKMGDYIGKLSALIGVLLFISFLVKKRISFIPTKKKEGVTS
ncbi:apolipoprotein N-acyltransferase [Algivirga pacifica]|uniref:Apolipoprotein N-acyltransferase n=1 Tax=Algivirga pacifica TaxID=1162670 RepID=A0ABP9DIW7_9BACT